LVDHPRATLLFVSALSRAVRAFRYYDAEHAALGRAIEEAMRALKEALRTEERLTIGCAGRGVVVEPDQPILTDHASALIAKRMFLASIVAIRIDRRACIRDLEALVALLSKGLRSPSIDRQDAVEIVEVDFDALFSGRDAREALARVSDDAIAESALFSMLRVHEEEDGIGAALGFELANAATPMKLGEHLEALLARAEPSDDFADRAVSAYFEQQASASASGVSDPGLSGGAYVLSGILVRLTPEARFHVLRRLAGGETSEDSGEGLAAARVLTRLPLDAFVDAVADALIGGRRDPSIGRAVGNLLRRVRPLEAERAQILDRIDCELKTAGHQLDGVLWQTLKARALDRGSFGLVEVDIRERIERLLEATEMRRRGELKKALGDSVLGETSEDVLARSAAAMAVVIQEARVLTEGLSASARSMVDACDRAGLYAETAAIVRAISKSKTPSALELVRSLLAGELGGDRSVRLVSSALGFTRIDAEIILTAIARGDGRIERAPLVERLARFGPDLLVSLGEEAKHASLGRVRAVLEASMKKDPKIGIKIARLAVANGSAKVKEAVLHALVRVRSGEALGLIAVVAGWKGERIAKRVVDASDGLERSRFEALQKTAVELLGESQAPSAVVAIEALLSNTKLLGSKHDDEMKRAAVGALLRNGTREARAALERAAKHRKRFVRDACARGLRNMRVAG
jgi:hypothetical protein